MLRGFFFGAEVAVRFVSNSWNLQMSYCEDERFVVHRHSRCRGPTAAQSCKGSQAGQRSYRRASRSDWKHQAIGAWNGSTGGSTGRFGRWAAQILPCWVCLCCWYLIIWPKKHLSLRQTTNIETLLQTFQVAKKLTFFIGFGALQGWRRRRRPLRSWKWRPRRNAWGLIACRLGSYSSRLPWPERKELQKAAGKVVGSSDPGGLALK